MASPSNSSQNGGILGVNNKTSFGDWTPDYRIFKDPNSNIDRNDFLRIFGSPNEKKNGRYSWSGFPVPKVTRPSPYNGSIILVTATQNIQIIYNYSTDPRSNKSEIVPTHLQVDNLILVEWTKDNLEKKLLNKFGQSGWFKCLKNKNGEYSHIAFGAPMNFANWIKLVEQGVIFFDGGMKEDNDRPYSLWRASNKYWDSLITHTYPPFPPI